MDVVAITEKDIHEVEIKVSKYDLWNGEEKKDKHVKFKDLSDPMKKIASSFKPSKFSVCVPKELESEAMKWAESVNDRYGVAIINGFNEKPLWIKTARRLYDPENMDRLKHSIMMRVCCENISMMDEINRRIKDQCQKHDMLIERGIELALLKDKVADLSKELEKKSCQ